MGYGLFGKLPQKRDFVSLNLPHEVLHPFETWLQSAVGASRTEIGDHWQDYYMVSPIWRFWIGSDVLGTACAGAIMPSLDQVGRYFPLAAIWYAEAGEDLPPPLVKPNDDWFVRIEERLLATLSPDFAIDPVLLLHGLAAPSPSVADSGDNGPAREAPAMEPASPTAADESDDENLGRQEEPGVPTVEEVDEMGKMAGDTWMSLDAQASAAPSALNHSEVAAPVDLGPMVAEESAADGPIATVAALPTSSIETEPYKKGQTTVVVGDSRISDFQLLEIDYIHACRTRSYWWCEPSPTGNARLHATAGLPDPFFYSRMLMWQPKEAAPTASGR